jgi:hypothetical protein
MIDLATVHGKRMAMMAWGKKEDGTDDVVAFTGIADWDGKRLRLLREKGEVFEVLADFWDRIRPVNEEVKDILLNAEFCFSVTVGNLGDAGADGLLLTGLKWPTQTPA